MAFTAGDYVDLLIDGQRIGHGKIYSVSPDDTCHRTRLGNFKVSVEVLSALPGIEIPFPFGDVETVSDAVGNHALWRKSNIALSDPDMSPIVSPGCESEGETPPDNGDAAKTPPDHGDAAKTPPDHGGAAKTPPNHGDTAFDLSTTAPVDRTDYSDRKNWHMWEAILLHPQDPQHQLAVGFINFNLPVHRVHGCTLGDTHVGVFLTKIFNEDEAIMKTFFPSYDPRFRPTVVWNVSRVLIPSKGLRLSDICSDGLCKQIDSVPDGSPLPTKRHYNFFKRKRADPEKKRRQQFAKNASDWSKKKHYLTPPSLLVVLTSVVHESIIKERVAYWSLCPSKRETMILEKFSSRGMDLIRKGKMIFDSKIVCKQAFYQLYGFGKTLFYKYQGKYEGGAKVGFH